MRRLLRMQREVRMHDRLLKRRKLDVVMDLRSIFTITKQMYFKGRKTFNELLDNQRIISRMYREHLFAAALILKTDHRHEFLRMMRIYDQMKVALIASRVPKEIYFLIKNML